MSDKTEEKKGGDAHHDEGNPAVKFAIGLVAIGAAIWAFVRMFGDAFRGFGEDVATGGMNYAIAKQGIIGLAIAIAIGTLAIAGAVAAVIKFYNAGKAKEPAH